MNVNFLCILKLQLNCLLVTFSSFFYGTYGTSILAEYVMSHIRRLFQKRQKMFIPLSRAFIRLLFYSSILIALSLKFTANSKVTACAA